METGEKIIWNCYNIYTKTQLTCILKEHSVEGSVCLFSASSMHTASEQWTQTPGENIVITKPSRIYLMAKICSKHVISFYHDVTQKHIG